MSDSTVPPEIARLDTTLEKHLANLNASSPRPLDGIATGAVIFSKHHDSTLEPRVLLIQRSSTDSMPDLWEIPGGAVDAGETILAGAAREVREETGLDASRITHLVVHDDDGDDHDDHDGSKEGLGGGYLFHTRRGRTIVKFTFVVEVESTLDVQLDPKEHQDYIWATENECRTHRANKEDSGKKDAVDLKFTTAAQESAILKAFAWRRANNFVIGAENVGSF